MFLCVLGIISQAKADEDYWHSIYQLLESKAPDAGTQFKKYMESLSTEQLLVAARQCSIEIQKSNPEDWEEVSVMCFTYFFEEYYPAKTNNLEDISPLLSDLKDKSQLLVWRGAIMRLLSTDWGDKLNQRQSFDAADAMNTVLVDTSEPVFLRVKAARESTKLFRSAYKNIFCNDPNVKQLVMGGKSYDEIEIDVQAGRVKLANETIQMQSQIKAAIAQSIQSQLKIFAGPNLTVYLDRDLIATLTKLRGFDSSGLIKKAMSNALKNYENHDQQLWQQLARTNIVYFDNQEAESILEEMIGKAEDKRVESRYFSNRTDLLDLKKQVDKGKIKKQPHTMWK